MSTHNIDDKKTIAMMKQQMQFLKQYCAQLRLYSTLYEEHTTSLQVEDSLVDYLHYTSSIIHCNTMNHTRKDPYLKAMERQEQRHLHETKQEKHVYELLQSIHHLKKQEADLLFDFYVRCYSRHVIMQRQGEIVESTLNRRLNQALLHLAILLCMEIYEKDVTETVM